MALVPNWIDAPNLAYLSADVNSPNVCVRRIGSRLYAVNVIIAANPFAYTEGYTSDDAGQTWTYRASMGSVLSAGTETTQIPYIHLFPHQGRLCKITVYRGPIDTGKSVEIEFLNLTSLEWEDYQLLAIPSTQINTNHAGSFAGSRSDGTIIIAVQYQEPTNNLDSTAVWKWDAGSVTQLGSFEGGGSFGAYFWYEIQNGFMDSSGNSHLFIVKALDTGDVARSYNHVSVAASDDAVSSLHLIEADVEIEDKWWNTSFGSGCQIPDGTLTTAYGYRIQTNWENSTAYGELHVAFGDTSGDPLNPSWTITTVNATPDFTWINGSDTFASTCWQGGKLRAYYATPYPRALVFPNNRGCRLWRATYDSGWGTPEEWFDPPGGHDTTPFPAGLFSFFLVRDFNDDVGIVVDCNAEVDSVRYEYAGYGGPPITVVRNYASAGGALAGPGSYASA